MKTKSLLTTIALFAMMSLSALAQVGRMEGEVLSAADGTPVVGADVQIHRNDIKWSANLKTDKKGKFIHAGVQYGGTYTIIIGADGFRPDALFGMKPDQTIPPFKLSAGDGKRLTIEEVKAGSKGGGSGAPAAGAAAPSAAATKKAEEEYKKKLAEVENKNKKIEGDNKAMNDALAAGKNLLSSKDYNGALAEFEKGLAIDAEQNVFWFYKGLSLYNRGVTRLNESLAAKDDQAKMASLKETAKADFTESINAATKSLALFDASVAAAGAADAAKAAQDKSNKVAYLKVRADSAGLIGERYFEAPSAEAANKDYVQMAEMSDDQELKKKYMFKGAESLRIAGALLPAQNAYKAIIALDPNYAEAYYGMGLSFFGDEKTFQDGANYLQFFIDKAPATDPRVGEAKAAITQMNLKPSKAALDALKKDAGNSKPAASGKKKN